MPRGSGNTRDHLRRRERDGHPFASLEDMYLASDAVPSLELAEWEEPTATGTRSRILRGAKAVQHAPAHASRYTEKTFTFATGVVRELTFTAAAGGVFRAITVEKLVYLLAGSAQVEVGGKIVALEAGDAVANPSGILRGAGDAKAICWTVTHTYPDATDASPRQASPRVARRSDRRVTESAQWDEGGPRIVATTPAERRKAPPDAIRLRVESMDLGCNVVAEVKGYRGGPTYEAAPPYDNYLYIVSGAYRYFQDDVSFEARPGDVIREISGHYHHWIRHEDSSFVVATSLPIGPASTNDS